jgi:protease-4
MDDAKLDKVMEDAWMADAEPMVKSGLLDGAVDLPQLAKELESQYGGGEVTLDSSVAPSGHAEMDMSNPFAMVQMLAKPPQQEPTRDTIAVLHINGTIIDGDSKGGGLGGGEGSVGSRTIRNAIEELKENDHIKGVVVRIDSPGGSAMASEIMWQGLRRLAATKPVWASVGSMAASGGYYVAVGTDKIYVNPSSIVGSIGVVGGKVAMAGLLEKVHVNTVSRARGPRAGMFNSTNVWTDAERELVRKKMTETYNQFTSRVTAGRKGIELEKTAAGRLFTGNKAIGLKMADKIGGLEVAIDDLAGDLKLGEYDVLDYPAPKSFAESIGEMLGGMVQSPRVGSKAQVGDAGIWQIPAELAGPQAWPQIRQGINTMLMLRDEPVLVVNPSVFIFKNH